MSLKSTFLGKMGTEWKYKITNDNQSRSQVKLDIKPHTFFFASLVYLLTSCTQVLLFSQYSLLICNFVYLILLFFPGMYGKV